MVISFKDCDPLAQKAVGEPEEIRRVEDFIHQKGVTAYVENTDEIYLSAVRRATHKFLRVVNSLYSLFIPILFVIALLWQIKQLARDITEKRFEGDGMLNLALFGILGMAVLRCAMIAFVEVSCFGIGTYVMYLSTVHPLIIAYSFVGFAKTMES